MHQRILVLAPHTDDGEFGCGGTIAKFVEEKKDVYYVAFSPAEKSVPPEFCSSILKTEVKEATQVLGIPKENLILFDYEVRNFPSFRQNILEDLVKIKKEISPDLVFLPSLKDLHQDHQTLAMEGLRAFKNTTILGYEIPWNNLTFPTSCFIALQKKHIHKKSLALKCYASQAFRNYASKDFIYALAKTRGTQIGVAYAEVFDVVRMFME